jgi:CheY-like chemotaxis protein
VLLVEDHPDSARMLARLLSRSGWSVRTANDVASALRSARAERFDLVVSDIGLPDGTGLDLMRQLRVEQPALRGIALSGHGMESDIQLSRDAGFTAHLVKPVSPQALEQVIGSVFEGEAEPSPV